MNSYPKSSRTQGKAKVERRKGACEGESEKIYGQGRAFFQENALSGCEDGGVSSLVICSYSVNSSSYPVFLQVLTTIRKICNDFGQTVLLLRCEASGSRKATNSSNVSSKRRITNQIAEDHLDRLDRPLRLLLHYNIRIRIAHHNMPVKGKNDHCVP
jgi:hypothetical protein